MLWIARFFAAMWRIAKRLLKISLFAAVLLGIATTVTVLLSGDSGFQYRAPDTLVNDVTQVNPVHVARVVRPVTVDEVVATLRATSGPVSIGGGRYSQGGQIAYPDSVHLDMRGLNEVIALDTEARTITVQAGITWREIQTQIDPHDLAVRIMQTYANFTVGGSLSVNVHGRYIGEGPLVRSVESIRLVLANGDVVLATPESNAELFYAAIGGYGGVGVIVEATLRLADNTRVRRDVTRMALADYRAHFVADVRDNDKVVFHNADLYPPDYDELLDVTWYSTDEPVTVAERLRPTDHEYVWQPRAAGLVATLPMGTALREHIIDPLIYRKDLVAWRNWEASYDVAELEPKSRRRATYVLREYFVPVDQLESFAARMREIFNRHDANILNVSIRHALEDPGTLLAWARGEVFAFVVYYRQGTDRPSRDAVAAWSRELIDATLDAGGTWYLPYQIFATPEQFHRGYPRAGEFFALKARVDPDNRFRNALWQQHYPSNWRPLQGQIAALPGYLRGEEQTLLTVPEWYLVFNPLEYAEFLEQGNDPDQFPFFDSIDEYWSLYDRVRTIAAAEAYPPNNEYLTMLRVIGISTTAEFLLKGSYEKTLGRATRWLADGEDTEEDRIIARAHRAYSDLIFEKAWYEFDFSGWLKAIWTDSGFFGPHFVRKLERKLFFTVEFGFKQAYAKLIGLASRSAYGEQEKLIYFTATPPAVAAGLPEHVRMVDGDATTQILSVPRWGPFTEAIPQLAARGYDFVDISGNTRIVVSLVADEGETASFLPAEVLFMSRFVSDPTRYRIVLVTRVADLREMLAAATAGGLEIEHIYDY